MTLEDWIKFLLPIVVALAGIFSLPAIFYKLNKMKLTADITKVNQDTESVRAQTAVTIASALKMYQDQLAKEIEDGIGKSKALTSMQDQINIRDARIDAQDKTIADQALDIQNLTTEVTSLKTAKTLQDAQLAELTKNLAAEHEARLTAVTELGRLKTYSEKTVSENHKLSARVKKLEDILIKEGIPLPNGKESL